MVQGFSEAVFAQGNLKFMNLAPAFIKGKCEEKQRWLADKFSRFRFSKRSGGHEDSILSSRAKSRRIEGCGFAGPVVGQPAPFDTRSTSFRATQGAGTNDA